MPPRTPIFRLLFVMMTMMSTGALMVILQMGAFAKDFGISDVTVFGRAALPLALSLDRITNGLTRPFLGRREIFSLFPSTLTDTFGPKHATVDYGFFYMAQGLGPVLGGPVVALLHQNAGSWMPVFALIVTMDPLTGALALFALKPTRRRWRRKPSRRKGAARLPVS